MPSCSVATGPAPAPVPHARSVASRSALRTLAGAQGVPQTAAPPAVPLSCPARASHPPVPSACDPDTSPLAAGLAQLSGGASLRSSAAGSAGSHGRRSSNQGGGHEVLGTRVGSHGSSAAAAAMGALPGPVPHVSTLITFMPLGHQGSKWAAGGLGPCAPPSGEGSCAATVAAVGVLTRSTAAAVLGEERARGSGRATGQGSAACASAFTASSAAAGAAAPPLPAYRPWAAVQRVIDEVGREAGATPADAPPLLPPLAGTAACGSASLESAGTVAMPWGPQPAWVASSANPGAARRGGVPNQPPTGRSPNSAPLRRLPQPFPPPVRGSLSCPACLVLGWGLPPCATRTNCCLPAPDRCPAALRSAHLVPPRLWRELRPTVPQRHRPAAPAWRSPRGRLIIGVSALGLGYKVGIALVFHNASMRSFPRESEQTIPNGPSQMIKRRPAMPPSRKGVRERKSGSGRCHSSSRATPFFDTSPSISS